VAFDLKTGKELWKCSDELASYASPKVYTLKGKRVGLYFARGGLVGFDPVLGQELFRYPWRARILESVNAANPVVVGDRIFLTESYEKGSIVLEFDGKKVKPVWADTDAKQDEPAMMAHWCTPVEVGGFLYGCSARHTNEADLRCVNLATGEVMWRVKRTTRCTVMAVDGYILALSEGGEVRLFRADSTKYDEVAKWESPELDYPAWAPPVLSRGLLYLRGKNKLVCYELKKSKD
jgi:outer membrane protein assembly factor BamB